MSLLYGCHLYPDLENEPANGYFYMPMGAWAYLPVAIIGKLLKLPTVTLFFGWVMTLVFFFAPIIILIRKLNLTVLWKILIFLLTVLLVFSNAPMTYVANLIHVDAPGICFVMSALVVLLTIEGTNKRTKLSTAAISGILLALAILTKQTYWPLVALILAWAILTIREIKTLLLTFAGVALLLMGILFFFEKPQLVYQFAIKAALSAPKGVSYTESGMIFLKVTYPLILIEAALLTLATARCSIHKHLKSIILLIGAAIVMTPLAIHTFTKVGADTNHFIIPEYLLLLSIIITIASTVEVQKDNAFYPMLATGFVLLIACWMLTPGLRAGWSYRFWFNNCADTAFRYDLKHKGEIYFPWQVLSTLMAEGRMYHIEGGLIFERMFKMRERSNANLKEFLPNKMFKMAVLLPFWPSYLVDQEGLVETSGSPELPGWAIYQKQ